MNTQKTMNNHDFYLHVAHVFAMQGNCLKRNYGCVIVSKEGEIISAGNTHSVTPCHKCNRRFSRKGHGYDKCPSIHAEQEAIAGRYIPRGSVAYLFCVDSNRHVIENPRPCPTCSKLLKIVGINEVITMTEVIKL